MIGAGAIVFDVGYCGTGFALTQLFAPHAHSPKSASVEASRVANPASPIVRRGPTGFLLVHGLSGTPTELHYLAQQLEKEGHTVYCPLLDGHSGGTRTLRASRWQDWYASVERAHEKLQSVCETVIVGGSSAGGILSLILAARRPDQVSGLLLYAPTLRLDGWAIPRSFSLFRLVTQRWLAHYFHFSDVEPYGIKDERVRKLAFAAMQTGADGAQPMIGFPGTTVLEFRWLTREARRVLSKVRAPTLIIHPRDDDFSSLDGALLIQQRLGSRVETLVLDDSYHLVALDRQRDLVVDRTLRFVRSLESTNQTASLEEYPMPAWPLIDRPNVSSASRAQRQIAK
jgi:carboxylesterase